MCFFAEDAKTGQKAVFTGDTLFVGGCGRFFEGTAEEMQAALNKTLASLPDDTVVWVSYMKHAVSTAYLQNGHEYTASNLKFGLSIEPDNAPLKALYEKTQTPEGKVTAGKSTIGDEKEWNVFMRVGEKIVQEKTGETDPVKVMAKLREMKNNFK